MAFRLTAQKIFGNKKTFFNFLTPLRDKPQCLSLGKDSEGLRSKPELQGKW